MRLSEQDGSLQLAYRAESPLLQVGQPNSDLLPVVLKEFHWQLQVWRELLLAWPELLTWPGLVLTSSAADWYWIEPTPS